MQELPKGTNMILTPEQIAEFKTHYKKHVENYPDVPTLLASGKLVKKGSWYAATDKTTWDACANYASSFLITKNNEGRLRLHRPPTAQMKKNAASI